MSRSLHTPEYDRVPVSLIFQKTALPPCSHGQVQAAARAALEAAQPILEKHHVYVSDDYLHVRADQYVTAHVPKDLIKDLAKDLENKFRVEQHQPS